jgi:flagellar motor protein MotB
MEEESVMSKSWTLGVVGLLLAAAGCVPSDQYLDMKSKYEQERTRADRLQTENDRLRRGGGGTRGMTEAEIRQYIADHPELFPTGHTGEFREPIEGTERIPGGIRLKDLTFRSGSAELTSVGKAALDSVAEQIRKMGPGTLRVEGHTDTDPISHSKNASNWELSGKRAAAVVDYLVKKGAVDPHSAFLQGFGEYKPIGSEKSRNRRVDIYYSPKSGGGSEAPVERTRPAGSRSSHRDTTLK